MVEHLTLRQGDPIALASHMRSTPGLLAVRKVAPATLGEKQVLKTNRDAAR